MGKKQTNEGRYRMNDTTALKLGLTLNKNRRYRLNKKQEKEFLAIRNESPKRLFFDIETSPNIVYSFRIGYNININHDSIIEERKIICICYKWQDEDKVHYLTWDKNQCDKQMLKDFIKVANEADEVIAHNGDRFDIKWLRSRCVFHRVPMLHHYKTLDTLKKAKSGFYFNSNRLDYIAKFLGVGGKIETGGFDLWVNCMKNDEKALKQMVEYCQNDVVILEEVYLIMQSYIKHNTHHGVYALNSKADCVNCNSTNTTYFKTEITPSGTIKRMMLCNDCGSNYFISNRTFINERV